MINIFTENRNTEMLGFNFKKAAQKEAFEKDLRELMKRHEGVSFTSKFDLMYTLRKKYNYISANFNKEVIKEYILELYPYIYSENTELLIEYFEDFDNVELSYYLKNIEGEKRSIDRSKSTKLSRFTELFDVEYDVRSTIEAMDSTMMISNVIESSQVEFEEHELPWSVSVKNGYRIAGDVKNILRKVFEDEKKINVVGAMLDTTFPEEGKDEISDLTEGLNIPEVCLMLRKENDDREKVIDSKDVLIIRLESGFRKLTFWHIKGSDFTEEKNKIKEMLEKTLKLLLLKIKFTP